jgi:hypothetical protein
LSAPIPVGEITTTAMDFIGVEPLSWILGCIGIGICVGVISGFLGFGGGFLITPSLMSMGIPGIIAVGSDLTHIFGEGAVGAWRHRGLGNVDLKLGVLMIAGTVTGVETGAVINHKILTTMGRAGSDLFISIIYVAVLGILCVYMLRESRKAMKGEVEKGEKKSKKEFAEKLQKLYIPPMMKFKESRLTISIWMVLAVGYATGLLAGTMGAGGGFIRVPALVYAIGCPTTVAVGTDLFEVAFSGAYGAFTYLWKGLADMTIALFILMGSVFAIHIGTAATKYVKGAFIRFVFGIIVGLAAVSRIVNIPAYLHDLGKITLSPSTLNLLPKASIVIIFGSAICVTLIIVVSMLRGMKAEKAETA